MIADRLTRVSPSATLRVGAEADALRRQGVALVDFGQGEPDFATPDHIKTAAREAIEADFTKYTPAAGILELRQALCAHYQSVYGVEFAPAQTLFAAGGKQALFNVMMAILDRGDEVVTHRPCWPTIPEQVKLAEAVPVMADCRPEDGFAIHAGALTAAVTARTKAIVVNSPCNPTGAIVSEEALREIGEVAARRDLWVIVDSCYEHLVYEPVPHNLPAVLASRLPERFVIAGSCSKSFAMTGWRCGWVVGPAALIAACNTLQGHSTSNVTSITQIAALAALTGGMDAVHSMREEYRRRRDAAHAWFTADPRVRCVKPAGAFYLFLDVTAVLSSTGIPSSAALAEALLHRAHIVVTPGEGFDAPGYIRISYATSMDHLREGAERFQRFLREL